MFQRFLDDGLAQCSYLIACERTQRAAIVDPRRDIDVYTSAARQRGLMLDYAIETHIHADFVSGARELSALGAQVVAGPGAALEFPFHEAADGSSLRVGDIALEFLHTPGHTPEHISIVVRERDRPVRVLTGDTLFVGAVGRPDLLGADQARQLAGQLYDSLFDKLLTLSDEVEVHPGHGAGSLCGAGIGSDPYSTIYRERRFNAMLQHPSKAAFVTAVLDDLPETPAYFSRMKRVNRSGPPIRGLADGVPPPRPLAARDAAAAAEDGAFLIDLRGPDRFGAGHPSGAINIGFGSRVGYWAGWVLPHGVPLVLLGADARQAADANRQLLRVGFDHVVGAIDGGYGAWVASGGPVSHVDSITARDLRHRLTRDTTLTLVDVRSPREWQSGHIDRAINMPVGDLPGRVDELHGSAPVVAICEGGFRSSLASSLLLRAGIPVVNVTDGTAAYRALD
jgi:hydroxyacylglutathione hydrolase